MRPPNVAIWSTAVLAAGLLWAFPLRAQTVPAAPASAGSTSEPESVNPMSRGRTARSLMRNGQDFINYGEFERALGLLREAESRQIELSSVEKKQLQQAIQKARDGLRAPEGNGSISVARSARPRRSGSVSVARSAPSVDAIPIQGGSANVAQNPPPADAIPRRDGSASVAQNAPPADTIPLRAIPDLPREPIQLTGAPSPDPSAVKRADAAVPVAASTPAPAPIEEPPPPPTPVTFAETPAPTPQPEPAALPEPAPSPAVAATPERSAEPIPTLLPEPTPVMPAAAEAPTPTASPTATLAVQEVDPLAPTPLPAMNPEPAALPAASPDLGVEPPSAAPAAAVLPTPTPAPALSEREAALPVLPTLPSEAAPPVVPSEAALPVLPALPNETALPAADPPAPAPAPAVVEPPVTPDLPPVRDVPARAPESAEPALPPLPSAPAPPEALASPATDALNAESAQPLPPPAEELNAPPAASSPPILPPLPAAADQQAPARMRGAANTAETPLPAHVRREVEDIARSYQEEMRRDFRSNPMARPLPGSGGAAIPEASPNESRIELPRPPSPTEPRPIRSIPIPEEFVSHSPRNWEPTRKVWAAPATCHTPLYFQDAPLERYGRGVDQAIGPLGRFTSIPLDDPTQSNQRQQVFQPFWSIAKFGAQIVTWPVNMVMNPPWEAEYDLGYYRPGDRVPPDTLYLPISGYGPPLHGTRY